MIRWVATEIIQTYWKTPVLLTLTFIMKSLVFGMRNIQTEITMLWCSCILTATLRSQLPPALSLLADSLREQLALFLRHLPGLQSDRHPALLTRLVIARHLDALLARDSPALMARSALPGGPLHYLAPPHIHVPTLRVHDVVHLGLLATSTAPHLLSSTLGVIFLDNLVLHFLAALRLEPDFAPSSGTIKTLQTIKACPSDRKTFPMFSWDHDLLHDNVALLDMDVVADLAVGHIAGGAVHLTLSTRLGEQDQDQR